MNNSFFSCVFKASFTKRFITVLVLFSLFNCQVLAASEIPTDPFMNELWYWNSIHVPIKSQLSQGKETIVAVLDAGFDLNHEDLVGQYWKNKNEITNDHKDNDNNGYEDDFQGWDFVGNDPDPSPDVDLHTTDDTVISHGTLIAGMISSVANNGKGIAGISPKTKIMPLRIMDSNGVGNTTSVRDAILYAVKNNADVINLSFVSTKTDDRLQQTIDWAVEQGVVIVSVVGNGKLDLNKTPTYPACYDVKIGKNQVIGVAAVDQKAHRADFSNSGSNCTDISAPGVNIFGLAYHNNNSELFSTSYGGPWEGTSMAAPMVSATTAILKSLYPSLTPLQIRLSIMLSADQTTETNVDVRKSLGAGILNIDRAIQIASSFALGGIGKIETNKNSSGTFVVASASKNPPTVYRLDKNGKELNSFSAYAVTFKGGVRLAMGDVTGDGVEEIITAPGAGGGPHIRIFDLNGKLLNQFFAFDQKDRQGWFVSSGDVNNDGIDEILVSQDKGGTGQVKIFNRVGKLIGTFYPFGKTTFAVHIAVGNFDDKTKTEIVSTLTGSKDVRIRIFDGKGKYVRENRATKPTISGMNVAAGDLNNDGKDEIIVSADSNFSPWVDVYDALGNRQNVSLAYQSAFKGGVIVATGDIDKNNKTEILTVPMVSGGAHIRIFNSSLDVIGGFMMKQKFTTGLSIAVWNTR